MNEISTESDPSGMNFMTTPEQNLQLVRDAYKAVYSGDMEGFFGFMAEDIVLYEADSLPYGGVYKGLKEVRRAIGLMMNAWDNLVFDVHEITVGGDIAIVYLQMAVTGKKTQKSYSFPVAELWRFREGKVVEMRPIYWDTHRVLQCFGQME